MWAAVGLNKAPQGDTNDAEVAVHGTAMASRNTACLSSAISCALGTWRTSSPYCAVADATMLSKHASSKAPSPSITTFSTPDESSTPETRHA